MNEANKSKLKLGVWSAIGGAVIAMIIGFAWGGWVLGGTSQSLGEEMAQTAVVERLTPICVAQFNKDPGRDEKLKILREKDSWERGDYVKAQGWATMPFEKEPDNRVANSCSALIIKNNE